MVEDLYDLLTFHHLFDVAVHSAEVLLLCAEVLCGFAADLSGCEHHYNDHRNGEYRQRDAQHDHADERDYQRYAGIHHLRYTLADELTERINIVGVDRHDIAVRVLVKVLYRQGLHVREYIVSDIAHGALGDVDHQSVIGE